MSKAKGEHVIDVGFSLRLDADAYNYAALRAGAAGESVSEFLSRRLAMALDKLMDAGYQRLMG